MTGGCQAAPTRRLTMIDSVRRSADARLKYAVRPSGVNVIANSGAAVVMTPSANRSGTAMPMASRTEPSDVTIRGTNESSQLFESEGRASVREQHRHATTAIDPEIAVAQL
jgi:hypothetical protein